MKVGLKRKADKAKSQPIDIIEMRVCWYDTEAGDDTLSCSRRALPKRLLCHKHAGMKAATLRRRNRNKARRRTIQVARRRAS